MGTTLTAWQAGSFDYQVVVAIEGFPHLVTNGPTARAITAWAGTDFTQAIGGLFPDVDRRCSWDPFAAFPGGGRATLRVAPDDNDTIGIATARGGAGAGWQTALKTSVDCNDTTFTVATTASAPASGEAFIGSECFAYTGKTGTTFTGITRGMYSPFLTESGGRFGRPHRAGLVSSLNLNREPIISQYRRTWTGALVGVWIHRVVGGVLDVKAQAQLVFAGTIAELYDDAETGQVIIECADILDRVKNATLVRDPFKARIADGMYFRAGLTFGFRDHDFTTLETAADLACVAGAPADHTEFTEGWYTQDQFSTIVNDWLAEELLAGNLHGTYSLVGPTPGNGGLRMVMQWIFANDTANTTVRWWFDMPGHVAAWLGVAETYDQASPAPVTWTDSLNGGTYHATFAGFAPLRWYIPPFIGDQDALQLTDLQGTFYDQYDWLPETLSDPEETNVVKPPTDKGEEWGIFTIGGKPFVVGAINGSELRYPNRFFNHEDLNIRYELGVDPPNLELCQIYVLRGTFKTLFANLFFSTGTAAFNHATYDTFPQTLALGLPYDLLAAFETSIDQIPEGDQEMTLIVDEATTLEKLVNVDLILRGLHLVWRNQSLDLQQWSMPVAANAVAALTEANKARPARNRNNLRTTTSITRKWLTPIVKIMFDREWTSDEYRDGPLTLEDAVSIDDLGGDAPEKTLSARNMTKADVVAIAPLFLERMPLISRPAYTLVRSIAQTLYETLAPGSEVTITDGFARDPVTGRRGITARPALVTFVRYSLGGPEASNPTGKPTPQVGEVHLLLFPTLQPSTYCPSGQLDHTADAGGFTSGYNSATTTIRLNAHEFTETTQAVDAAWFIAGDLIEICEADPPDPANPLKWNREVDSVSGNDLTLTAALAAPAFDDTKKYRVRSQPYTSAQQSQRANVYQADDADNRIQDDADPFTFGLGQTGAATLEDHTAPSELVPTASYGDGVARDVGNERALIRSLNNFICHKSAKQSPALEATVRTQSSAGTRVLCIIPKFFGALPSTGSVTRYLSVAPWMRSSTGASVTITVTLARYYPVDDSLASMTIDDPKVSATFTTSSTTWQTPTPVDLDMRGIVDDGGRAVIIIESTQNGSIRGLAVCRQSERIW